MSSPFKKLSRSSCLFGAVRSPSSFLARGGGERRVWFFVSLCPIVDTNLHTTHTRVCYNKSNDKMRRRFLPFWCSQKSFFFSRAARKRARETCVVILCVSSLFVFDKRCAIVLFFFCREKKRRQKRRKNQKKKAKLYHDPTTYFSNPLKPSPRIQKKNKNP